MFCLFSNLQTANDLQLMQNLMNNQKNGSPAKITTPTSSENNINNNTTANNDSGLNGVVNPTTASLLSLISQTSNPAIKLEK